MSARCCAGQLSSDGIAGTILWNSDCPKQPKLACCCGSAGCSLCCGCCPKIRQSRTTRFMYLLYFVLVVGLCCVMMAPSVTKQIREH
ncbi:hypothetical protein STEG23_025094, partial [Scotinomys teguina]